MAKRKKRNSKKNESFKKQLYFELFGLSLFAISCIAIAELGAVGRAFVQVFRFFSGEWYIVFLVGLLTLASYLIWKREWPPFVTRRLVGLYIMLGAFLLLSHVKLFQLLSSQGEWADPSVIRNTWEMYWMEVKGETSTSDLGGGIIGSILFALFYYLFDSTGTKLVAFFFILAGLILLTGRTLNDTVIKVLSSIFTFVRKQVAASKEDVKEWMKSQKEKRRNRKEAKESEEKQSVDIIQVEPHEEPIISDFAEVAYGSQNGEEEDQSEVVVAQDYSVSNGTEPVEESTEAENTSLQVTSLAFTEIENEDYKLPPMDLLHPPKHNSQHNEKQQITANARKLEKTFQSFGVKAKVAKVHLGPAVTKYEVYPDVGVKVSKIVNLSDDLALALAAKDIRIEAPIPGKSAVGIEVPNKDVAMVSLKEVLDTRENKSSNSKLLIGFGRDISGDAVLAELNKMPHLLVAGATGSGKSVCINGIITSILMRAKPHEVKLMMIDPKMVELNVYNGIPHLLAPVVTDPKKASQALKKVVSEMERRYELFSHTGTRNIEGYNEFIKRNNQQSDDKQPLLPYIVVIVDELADLMMVASNDVEDAITRLAQMARAAGIHLIIATQRPSVDVITGVIKANIPSRIAFSVSSQTDSRTILDMGGAEKLLGRGDMLFLPVGASKPVRVQGAFLSDEEVEEIVNFVIAQQKAQYQAEMIPDEEPEQNKHVEVEDALFDDAVQLVVEMQTASVSMLQRRFRVGYTRAARLIDAMEAKGIVGPYEGSRPREVLISKHQEEASS